MAKIVIIGAGATGLSAAFHLERKGFHDYLLVEKESTTGGLCRSIRQDGFTFDFTGHVLHISDDYVRSFMNETVGLRHFNRIGRRSFIYSHGSYTHYPFQINLRGLPSHVIAECIEGYVSRKRTRAVPRSFRDWVLQTFGAGFGKHFFFPYQRKIFDYDLRKLSASWTGRFVPQTSLHAMLMGALEERADDSVGYNANFFYPSSGGISFWVDALAEHLRAPIYTNCPVERIDARAKRVIFSDGSHEPYDQLINTMPLDTLLGMLHEPSNTRLVRARDNLKCSQVVNLNIGVVGTNWPDRHWVYVPEKRYPFYRMGFPHNLSAKMVPTGCSSLSAELSHLRKSAKTVAKAIDATRTSLMQLLNFTQSDILTEKIIHIPHAYVIYDYWRDKHIAHLHQRLNNLQIYSVGRYGEWKYASMQEAILDGRAIAEHLAITPAQRAHYMPEVPVPQAQKLPQPAGEQPDQ